jgi:hypothetical protein
MIDNDRLQYKERKEKTGHCNRRWTDGRGKKSDAKMLVARSMLTITSNPKTRQLMVGNCHKMGGISKG